MSIFDSKKKETKKDEVSPPPEIKLDGQKKKRGRKPKVKQINENLVRFTLELFKDKEEDSQLINELELFLEKINSTLTDASKLKRNTFIKHIISIPKEDSLNDIRIKLLTPEDRNTLRIEAYNEENNVKVDIHEFFFSIAPKLREKDYKHLDGLIKNKIDTTVQNSLLN